MNTIGKLYRLTSFGESHGPALGGVIDGCPPGVRISVERIQQELDRRRPGQSALTTSRQEADKVEILSGIFEGKTTGAPIGFLVRNTDARERDYGNLKDIFRPSHADYSWQMKYGHRDYRGGGRSSAREHVARVVAGAIACQVLDGFGVSIRAFVSRVGNISLDVDYRQLDLALAESNPVRCPDPVVAARMMEEIMRVRDLHDSVGGVVTGIVQGVPMGLGEPVFDRFQARLAYYMMGINAAKGFEYGEGFRAAMMRGSEHNDEMIPGEDGPRFRTNHAGGILGGITTGEDICFRVAFKPVPTIGREQHTVDKSGQPVAFTASGRHDPCVAPRAVPVVEAMTAMLLLDALLEADCYYRFVGLKK